MTKLTLIIDFTIGEDAEPDKFELGGDVKAEAASNLIQAWLVSQISAGVDSREPNKYQSYHIELDWEPSHDKFTARSNCGNDGLRDGLLLHVLKELTKK